MALRALFATEIYQANLAEEPGFDALLPELIEASYMLADEDRAGRAWSKAHGYRGYTSYASLDDLPRRATAFAELARRLDRHAATFAKALSFELGGKRLKLDSLWVNILKPGGAHSGHIHPLSVLSGTLYLATPPGSGQLKLEDPRLERMMARPPLKSDAPEIVRPFVYLTPEPGSLLVWESWLRHEVVASAAKGDRISLSFNYGWR
jgi:uncharacterized protein (TIGR02466 family)